MPVVVRRGPRPRRHEALRGVKLGLRSHSGFAVHIFTATAIMAGAITLNFELWEWAILLVCVGVLFSAELFHSALRSVIGHLDSMPIHERERVEAVAAGAVLVVRLMTVLVAFLFFVTRILDLLSRA